MPGTRFVETLRRRVTRLCLALPDAAAVDVRQHTKFIVRGRTLAYFLVDHHGDGMIGVIAKARAGDSEELIRDDPDRYYRPTYLGSKGWVGIRLDVEPVPWDAVSDLLRDSFRLVAPKSLVRDLDD